jgi:hypothetical protein
VPALVGGGPPRRPVVLVDGGRGFGRARRRRGPPADSVQGLPQARGDVGGQPAAFVDDRLPGRRLRGDPGHRAVLSRSRRANRQDRTPWSSTSSTANMVIDPKTHSGTPAPAVTVSAPASAAAKAARAVTRPAGYAIART